MSRRKVEERRIPFPVYVAPSKMEQARQTGMLNFSGLVNQTLDEYIQKRKQRSG